MLNLYDDGLKLGDGIRRRALLSAGSVGGLTLPQLMSLRAADSESGAIPRRAKAVILCWLTGGVPQHDTWDPKPDGPDAARSEFGAIATRTPGLSVGALMPKTAALTNHVAVLRAMVTGDNAHSSSGYQMLTGIPHQPLSRENALPGTPNDWPSLDAMARILRRDQDGLPSSIVLPRHIANVGEKVWPGQDAGFMGRKSDPWLLTCDPAADDFNIDELKLQDNIDRRRFAGRQRLLSSVNAQIDGVLKTAETQNFDRRTQQAIDLITGQKARDAFDLSRESDATRDRYGRSKFGQSVLLARRLVEAGVSLVHVNWQRIEGKENNGSWDTHKKHHESLKGWLMPRMDAAYSSLLTDLRDRGLLDETLVAWVGEFGHTPKINTNAGRDHWGRVFSIALAGGGIRGGVVHGATDNQAGEPISGRTTPADYIATVLHCMGISPESTLQDPQGRPFPLSRGRVIEEVLV